jgi:hypothetical protein
MASIRPRIFFISLWMLASAAAPLGAEPAAFKWELQKQILQTTSLVADHPRLGGLTEREHQKHVEFIMGNTLFVLGHEVGHAIIREMVIPVIGREEDAADSFSTLLALSLGEAFADQVLINTATGWFYSNRRDRHDGIEATFYDEHGMDLQRAYHVVCLMVGSNPGRFRELADEAGIPEERQGRCKDDYNNASWSWSTVTERHRRRPAQPIATVNVVYGNAEGELVIFARAARHMKLLETAADMLAEQYAWPAAISLEFETCGDPGARWEYRTRKIIICYEIMAEFSQLYRAYRKTDTFALDDMVLALSAAREDYPPEQWRTASE